MTNYIKCYQFLTNNIYKLIDGKKLNDNCEDINFTKNISEGYRMENGELSLDSAISSQEKNSTGTFFEKKELLGDFEYPIVLSGNFGKKRKKSKKKYIHYEDGFPVYD